MFSIDNAEVLELSMAGGKDICVLAMSLLIENYKSCAVVAFVCNSNCTLQHVVYLT